MPTSATWLQRWVVTTTLVKFEVQGGQESFAAAACMPYIYAAAACMPYAAYALCRDRRLKQCATSLACQPWRLTQHNMQHTSDVFNATERLVTAVVVVHGAGGIADAMASVEGSRSVLGCMHGCMLPCQGVGNAQGSQPHTAQ